MSAAPLTANVPPVALGIYGREPVERHGERVNERLLMRLRAFEADPPRLAAAQQLIEQLEVRARKTISLDVAYEILELVFQAERDAKSGK